MTAEPRAALTFHEVDADRWSDLVRLFEARGGPKACWCMVWRRTPEGASPADGAARRAALGQRVTAGVPIGILGYADDEPVAWCSIAPRDSYRPLGGADEPEDTAGAVWSIVCFFVPRRLRGRGLMRALIQAAVTHAAPAGARAVEAYPVDADSPSYRFMGFVETFRAAGFEEVGRAGTRRHVMRYRLRTARHARP